MHISIARLLACTLALAAGPVAVAKPIAFANGTSVMAEYGAGTMAEAQVFHAPRYWWSYGGGRLELDSSDGSRSRTIDYVRVNVLARRWNLEAAQGNVFAWGGVGSARGNDFSGREAAWHVGAQADYETRRVYASLKSELHEADSFSHRIDTLQLGWAPYAHDYDTLAAWIVLQARGYTGGLYEGTESALLLRLFRRGVWVETGVTTDRKLQLMMMFNF